VNATLEQKTENYLAIFKRYFQIYFNSSLPVLCKHCLHSSFDILVPLKQTKNLTTWQQHFKGIPLPLLVALAIFLENEFYTIFTNTSLPSFVAL